MGQYLCMPSHDEARKLAEELREAREKLARINRKAKEMDQQLHEKRRVVVEEIAKLETQRADARRVVEREIEQLRERFEIVKEDGAGFDFAYDLNIDLAQFDDEELVCKACELLLLCRCKGEGRISALVPQRWRWAIMEACAELEADKIITFYTENWETLDLEIWFEEEAA